jgi:uncharacterized membrane protein
MAPPPTESLRPRNPLVTRLRNYLLAGLLALAPSVVTLWIFFRLLNWVDNLLGRYLRFSFVDYHRIPGLGLLATLVLLVLVGWVVTGFGRWLGGRSVLTMWDAFLTRIPGVGILYGSTKSVGEAFFRERRTSFQQVVLVQWPHPGLWRVGFLAAPAGADVREHLGEDIEVVFVPHTPNPASGFVHYAPRSALRFMNWSIEEALRVIISGGVVQPDSSARPARTDAPVR